MLAFRERLRFRKMFCLYSLCDIEKRNNLMTDCTCWSIDKVRVMGRSEG